MANSNLDWMNMSNAPEHEAEQLSALADGELDATGVARACALWRADASAQETWHAYHLIGDVLRSEDLAGAARNDHAALVKLRERLSTEPVPFSPGHAAVRQASAPRRSRPWATLSAIAAGFAAVAVVLVVSRGLPGDESGRALDVARRDAAAPTSVAAATPRAAQPAAQPVLADRKLIRDARLDQYLDAHKHFSGVSALGVPSTFLRGATSDAAQR
jgi:sigma-E factor negative regulatory protein RseA